MQDDDREWGDVEAESLLYRIAELVDAGASEGAVAAAAEHAHLAGWDWAPIAILLGRDAGDVRRQFGGVTPSRVRRRFRRVRGWHPPAPRDSAE
jgi:hypothetical protein